MTIYTHHWEPPRIEGEEGWMWCDRYAAAIPLETFRRIMHEAFKLRRRDRLRRRYINPLWVYVKNVTTNGGGVSSAIQRLWEVIRDEFKRTAFGEQIVDRERARGQGR